MFSFRLLQAALLLALLGAARQSPAPIFGHFPGTEDMILDADAIVVAEVGELCMPEDILRRREKGEFVYTFRSAQTGVHDQHECHILKVLKGELEEGDALLALRWLGRPPCFAEPEWVKKVANKGDWVDSSGKRVSIRFGSAPGTYLIFLQGDPPLESTNCVGSIIPVPDGFDLSEIKDMTVEDAVHHITGDVEEPARRYEITDEQRAERRAMRLKHSSRWSRDDCISVQILENQVGKPGYNSKTGRVKEKDAATK